MPHKTCSVDGCEIVPNEHAARGYCKKHYTRWLKHGDPSIVLKSSGGKGYHRPLPLPQVRGQYTLLSVHRYAHNVIYSCRCSCGAEVIRRLYRLRSSHRGCKNNRRFKHTAATTQRRTDLVADLTKILEVKV